MKTTRRAFLATCAVLALPRTLRAAVRPIIVSSKIDVEGALLGELILLALDAAGIATESRLQLGPTSIVREALISGAIDIYPEYTGNAAFFFNLDADPAWKNAKSGYAKAAELDLARNKLVWLDPAPADNSWVIAIPKSFAAEQGLVTLRDFSRYVRNGGAIKLAASAEFVESDAGLPAFEAAYDFKLDAMQLLVLSGGATSATMKAAADGISGVNAAMAYSTDGGLDALDLVALIDSLHSEPVYAPAPVARASVIEAYPEIRSALEPIFAGLTLANLRRLNERIAVAAEDPKKVAQDYLKQQGIILGMAKLPGSR